MKTRTTEKKPAVLSIKFDPVVMPSSSSISPLAELYKSEAFQRAWQLDLGAQIARNLTKLRKHRGLSQAELARKAGTSQPAVARIESGEVNVTLHTLIRLAAAMDGALTFRARPFEVKVPRLPNWWEMTASCFSSAEWRHTFEGSQQHKFERRLGLGFVTEQTVGGETSLATPITPMSIGALAAFGA